MKYFVCGLLILALSAGFCVLGLRYENRHLGTILTLAEQAADRAAAGDTASALTLTEKAHTRWEAERPKLSLLLAHDSIRELDRCFGDALRALGQGSSGSADRLADLCSLLNGLLRREQLTWENII